MLVRVHADRGQAQRHQPARRTARELKIHVAVLGVYRRQATLTRSPRTCPIPLYLRVPRAHACHVRVCVYRSMHVRSMQQPYLSLFAGEERYRPLKAIYFSDHLPKAKRAGRSMPPERPIPSRLLYQRHSETFPVIFHFNPCNPPGYFSQLPLPFHPRCLFPCETFDNFN